MISHNEEFVGALCPEQWHVRDGRLEHKGHLAVDAGRFEDSNNPSGASTPRLGIGMNGSGLASGAGTPLSGSSAAPSAANSDTEGGDMKFRARKKKKMTRAEKKEQEVRRRLRHIEWLNSPKGECCFFHCGNVSVSGSTNDPRRNSTPSRHR